MESLSERSSVPKPKAEPLKYLHSSYPSAAHAVNTSSCDLISPESSCQSPQGQTTAGRGFPNTDERSLDTLYHPMGYWNIIGRGKTSDCNSQAQQYEAFQDGTSMVQPNNRGQSFPLKAATPEYPALTTHSPVVTAPGQRSRGISRRRPNKKRSGTVKSSTADDPPSDDDSLGLRYSENEIMRQYEIVRQPRAYFKKGRIFMILWTEASGTTSLSRKSASLFRKIRRFVVIRPKAGHCLCLPIHTYSGRATKKPGVNQDDHAILFRHGEEPEPLDGEKPLKKKPLGVIAENPSISISAASRINFGKVQTIEHNVQVRTIGRIHPAYLELLETYFLQSMGVNIASLTAPFETGDSGAKKI